MSEYLKDISNEFSDGCNKSISTPTAVNLNEIIKDQEKLNTNKQKWFHTFVAKLLFVSKQGRPNIQVAVAFLSTSRGKKTELDET